MGSQCLATAVHTHRYGYPPFGNGPARPSSAEAADRFVWGSLNIYRKASGNPVCGPMVRSKSLDHATSCRHHVLLFGHHDHTCTAIISSYLATTTPLPPPLPVRPGRSLLAKGNRRQRARFSCGCRYHTVNLAHGEREAPEKQHLQPCGLQHVGRGALGFIAFGHGRQLCAHAPNVPRVLARQPSNDAWLESRAP